jgi:hypothetical protein
MSAPLPPPEWVGGGGRTILGETVGSTAMEFSGMVEGEGGGGSMGGWGGGGLSVVVIF